LQIAFAGKHREGKRYRVYLKLGKKGDWFWKVKRVMLPYIGRKIAYEQDQKRFGGFQS
jgi:hypothetical protein